MKEVVIHIGTHKTGTSSIQHALRDYKDETTRVASFEEENHSIPIFTIFSENRYHYHIWRKLNLDTDAIDARRVEYLDILEADLADDRYDRLIISGEDISILTPSEKSNLIGHIKSKGVDVSVIVFTRSPMGFACSASQQRAKGGAKTWTPVNVNYRYKIDPFLEELGRQKIVVCDYDYIINSDQSVVDYFSDLVGINLRAKESKNESVSVQALALIYKVNNIPLAVLGDVRKWKIRQKLVAMIIEIFPPIPASSRLNPDHFSSLLDPTTKDDCLWLESIFGISYRYHVEVEDDLNAWLEESLSDYQNQLSELFSKFGTSYDPKRSLEENFLEAFFALFIHENGLFDSDAEYLLDVAEKIVAKADLETRDALSLMKLASRARPGEQSIRQRIDQLSLATMGGVAG